MVLKLQERLFSRNGIDHIGHIILPTLLGDNDHSSDKINSLKTRRNLAKSKSILGLSHM